MADEAEKEKGLYGGLKNLVRVMEELPKVILVVGTLIGMLGGATGIVSLVTSSDKQEVAEQVAEQSLSTEDVLALIAQHATSKDQYTELERRLFALEVERSLTSALVIQLLASHGVVTEKVEFEGFIVELESGEVTPMSAAK